MMDLSPLSALVLLLTSVLSLLWLVRFRRKYKDYPPGPWGVPVLGHLPFLGLEPWKTFLNWKKIYGPVIAVRFGSFNTIAITDVKLLKDIFSRSAVTGRGPLKIFKASNGKGLAFGDGPLVREQRAFVIRKLKDFTANSKQFDDVAHREVRDLFKRFDAYNDTPFVNDGIIFPTSVVNVVWSLFLGQRFEHYDTRLHFLATKTDEYEQKSLVCVTSIAVDDENLYFRMDGVLASLAAFIPWISTLFPEASGLTNQIAAGRAVYDFMDDTFKEPLPQSYIPGQPTNFKEAFIDEMKLNENNPQSSFHPNHNIFHTVIGDTYFAAMEATSKTMDWFLVYMILHQEIQEKLYKEIEHAIGTQRLPLLTDRVHMDYAQAVVAETLRYSTVVPIGMFRRVTEDITFLQYKIPKETLVVGNLYGCHFDPDVWDDPINFRPERHLDKEGKFIKSENLINFSTGKRSCIGSYLAKDQLFLYTTSLIQRYNVTCPPQNPPSMNGIPGFAISPKHYELIMRRRSADQM